MSTEEEPGEEQPPRAPQPSDLQSTPGIAWVQPATHRSGVTALARITDSTTERSLIVPSAGQLEVALAAANTLEELVEFEKMIALLKDAGSQFKVVIDEAIRIATCDIVTRRKIGTVLLQVAKHGGDRARGHRDLLLEKLLEDLGESKAKRCRVLARINDEHLADYLNLAAGQGEVPTEAGAIRYSRRVAKASQPGKMRRPTRSRHRPATAEISKALLDAVQRVLGEIDVCVGEAKVRCGARLGAAAKDKEIHGRVFITECTDPGLCLTKIFNLYRKGQVDEAVVLVPAEVGAPWFSLLALGEWHCCFPKGGGPLAAYLGAKKRGFVMTLGGVGPVFCGCESAN